MHAFTEAIRGRGPRPSSRSELKRPPPPKVRVENMIPEGGAAWKNLQGLMDRLEAWRLKHADRAKVLGPAILAARQKQRMEGLEVDYRDWW